jgi:hypothetical protein
MILVGIAFFWACGSPAQEGDAGENDTLSKQKELELLLEWDREVQTNPEAVTDVRALEIAERFRLFAQNNPDDEQTVPLMFKAAELFISQPGKALYGIELFARIHKDYPTHPLAPNAYFMMAMTFDAILQDSDRALMLYEGFLQQYPNHELAAEVQNLIALKKSPDGELEQVREWMKQTENK